MQTWQFLYFMFNKYIKFKNCTYWSFYLYGRFETKRFETRRFETWRFVNLTFCKPDVLKPDVLWVYLLVCFQWQSSGESKFKALNIFRFWKGYCHTINIFLKALQIRTVLFEWASSSNPLQGACSGFLIAACNFKSCSESRPWSWVPDNCSVSRQFMYESAEKPELNFDSAVGTSFRIRMCFIEASRNIKFTFLLNEAG